MSAALENYKTDNGVYPSDITIDARTMGDQRNIRPPARRHCSRISPEILTTMGNLTWEWPRMSFKSYQTGALRRRFYQKTLLVTATVTRRFSDRFNERL